MSRFRSCFALLIGIALTACPGDSAEDQTAADEGEAAAGGCVDGRPRLTEGGVGPVMLGQSLADIRSRCEVRDTTFALGEGMQERGHVVRLNGSSVVALTRADGRVSRIIVEDDALRTARNVGVGSTLAELRDAHGELCPVMAEGVIVVNAEGIPGISFETDADVRIARRGATIDAAALPNTARVQSLWVHEGGQQCGK